MIVTYDRQNIFIVQATDALLVYKLNTTERFKRFLKIFIIMLLLLLKRSFDLLDLIIV
jgi:hypothetical protein